jgi:hypothetical protein
MKKYILIALFITGCKQESAEKFVLHLPETDSIVAKNKKTCDSTVRFLQVVDKKSDEAVSKLITRMSEMKLQISSMKEAIKTKPKTITIHDTLIITEKKNFWGKTKRTVDSSRHYVDSTNN